MSFLQADLPSEDSEEDSDYDAGQDKTGEREDRPPPKKRAKRGIKRGRPAPTAEDAGEDDDGDADDGAADDDGAPSSDSEAPAAPLQQVAQTLAKKAKIEAVWAALNARDTGGPNAAAGPPSARVAIAALCGRTQTKELPSDLTWQQSLRWVAPQRQVAIVPPSSASPAPADAPASSSAPEAPAAGKAAASSSSTAAARAGAAAAIAAAKEAASLGAARSYGKVSVTETRRFAGKDIEVTREVAKNSKEAAALEAKKKKGTSGLDRFLEDLEKKKKVNVLDKSKMEWNQLKSKDAHMDSELERHKKSSNKYLEKVDFLKKAELRQYEIERDQRLGGDVRLRNRL
ncbi:hypothetical protein FOA52_002757 [Chlamydomonas sp. UWO 241]|nr:hypothetical protein FOA52_002757 [Chlamydomonas sp. UWO 241]